MNLVAASKAARWEQGKSAIWGKSCFTRWQNSTVLKAQYLRCDRNQADPRPQGRGSCLALAVFFVQASMIGKDKLHADEEGAVRESLQLHPTILQKGGRR